MTQEQTNEIAYEKALDDVDRLLRKEGRCDIGSDEFHRMLDAAMALHGWKEIKRGKPKAA